jgi:hypothetical protein
MSNDLDALTQQGMDALHKGDRLAANKAFAERDNLANQVYGSQPVPTVGADGAVVPPAESPGEPHIGVDDLADAELMSALSMSVSGRNLAANDVATAKANALEFEKTNPEAAAAWESYGMTNADAPGEITARLARGEIPHGGPDRYKDELASISQKHQAKRELEEILQANPPGSEAYRSNAVQRRVAALNLLIYAGEPIVGRWGRTA